MANFLMVLTMSMLLILSGCTSVKPIFIQPITISSVITEVEPVAPNSELATQRDVAVYLINLRTWGRTMKLQLDSVFLLLSSDADIKN